MASLLSLRTRKIHWILLYPFEMHHWYCGISDDSFQSPVAFHPTVTILTEGNMLEFVL